MAEKNTMSLPVPLSDSDLALRASDLANWNQKLRRIQASKSKEMSDYNAQIKEAGVTIDKLAQVVAEKKEMRDVEIEERPDYDHYMMQTFRLDTNAMVSERQMSTEERQTKLRFPQKAGKA